MNIMDFLFPNVAMARRETLARINAGRRQMDDAHEAEKPIRELITDVLPLARAAELAGERLTVVEVPRERIRAIEMAKAMSDAIMGRPCPFLGTTPGNHRLFGLEVVEGPELRVR